VEPAVSLFSSGSLVHPLRDRVSPSIGRPAKHDLCDAVLEARSKALPSGSGCGLVRAACAFGVDLGREPPDNLIE
jgi:hypothetical protein